MTREEASSMRQVIEDHRSVHEMLLAVARLCSDVNEENAKEFANALWPGLVVIMDRLSAEEDELLNKLRYIVERAHLTKVGAR